MHDCSECGCACYCHGDIDDSQVESPAYSYLMCTGCGCETDQSTDEESPFAYCYECHDEGCAQCLEDTVISCRTSEGKKLRVEELDKSKAGLNAFILAAETVRWLEIRNEIDKAIWKQEA